MRTWDPFLGCWNETPGIRADGWSNPYTGFGIFGRDRTKASYFQRAAVLDDEQLASLYYMDDISAKVVDTFPDEMLRQGYSVDGEDEDLLKQGRELDVDCKVAEAMKWGGLFGGALLILGAKGGNPLAQMPENPKGLDFLSVVDRRYVTVERYYNNPMAPKYGQPEVYRIAAIEGINTIIHESWTIRFEGPPTDPHERRQLQGWTYSVLQRPYETLQQFSGAWQSAGHLLSEASIGVFKLEGLLSQIASGELKNLQTRLTLADMSKSTMRSLMLDAQHESFERVSTSFSGLDAVLDRFMMRLSACTDIPVSVLMGRSAAGMNATGESDFRAFYNAVETRQKKQLKPVLDRLYSILAGKEVEVEFNPLWTPTAKEEAEIDKMVADTYAVYIGNEVLRPEAVALKEFRGTELVTDDQESLLEEALKEPAQPTPEEMALAAPAANPGDPVHPSPKAPVPGSAPTLREPAP